MFQKVIKYLWFIWLVCLGIIFVGVGAQIDEILTFSFIALSIIMPILGLIGLLKKNISRKWAILSIVCLMPVLLMVTVLLSGTSQGKWM